MSGVSCDAAKALFEKAAEYLRRPGATVPMPRIVDALAEVMDNAALDAVSVGANYKLLRAAQMIVGEWIGIDLTIIEENE